MSAPLLVSHPTGNANVRHAALAFAEAGLLREYWTGVDWDPGSALNRVLPGRVRRQLARRAVPDAVRPFTRLHPWREAGRLLSGALGLHRLVEHERGLFSVDAVFQDFDRRVARRLGELETLRGIYAYEDGALASFQAARALGIKCLYDLPIGYWRGAHALYAEESARQPEWAGTMSGMRDSAAKLARKDEELDLADVIMVASSFTRRTILEGAGRPTAPIHVVPYGAPASLPVERREAAGGPLRVMFAGSLGQRKGLSYLLAAVETLGAAVELTLLGQKVAPDCAPLNAAVQRHRWIPSLPHRGVLEEMARHDVFVFPSLWEGFGLVLLEAMAQGLPVITTPNTAGPDLFTDGVEGFIVPIRSAPALAEKLDLLHRDRKLLSDMRAAAQMRAQRHTWERYRLLLAQAAAPTLQTS